LYAGFDAWQSPNGFDILGVVIYWLADENSGNTKLEAVPLDFICLSQSHTGDYLAQKVTLVVEKFEIQHKVCLFISLSIISPLNADWQTFRYAGLSVTIHPITRPW
jgi:hypothetical protein